jgi:hypothetical protein
MAFKSFSQYQEDKNGDFFVLPNDKDSADVVFLYRNANDVLVADVHYLNTASYKGYAHCCETGCPACARNIKVQHKIFIPLFNVTKKKIEFWDRTTFFESILQDKVFKSFPNPSECVFRITRNGAAGSRETTYDILPIGRNSAMPYEKILADYGVTLPDYYSTICKEMNAYEMTSALNEAVDSSNLSEYSYTPVPRGAAGPAPAVNVTTPTYSEPPVVSPPVVDMPEYVPGAVPVAAPDLPDFANQVSESGEGSSDLDDVAF